MTDGKLQHGAFQLVSAQFRVHWKTCSRIWKQGQTSVQNGSVCADVASQIQSRCKGKKLEVNISSAIQAVPLHKRDNLRSLSKATGIAKSTLHRRLKKGELRRHSNSIKPLLSEENKQKRLEFCLSMIVQPEGNHESYQFDPMFDTIHIDEKLFYQTRTNQTYYLANEEPETLRTCQSKRFIEKVMFLAAVARPRFDTSRNQKFDGKLGIWPFTIQEPAKRKSKNRDKGALVTKTVVVGKKAYKEMLITKLLPAIASKLPSIYHGYSD